VTDRGPFAKGRIIDLSYRAAKELGILAQGVAMVEVEVYAEKIYPLMPPEEEYTPIEFKPIDNTPYDYHHPVWQQHDTHPSAKTKRVNQQDKDAPTKELEKKDNKKHQQID